MRELFRVLKPYTGLAILQVPISKTHNYTFEQEGVLTEEERLNVYGQRDHVRIYGTNYPQVLESIGFEVEVVDWATSKTLNPNG